MGGKHLFEEGACERQQLMDKAALLDFTIEIIRRSDTAKGFEILPRRWVVERTSGRMIRIASRPYRLAVKPVDVCNRARRRGTHRVTGDYAQKNEGNPSICYDQQKRIRNMESNHYD